MEENKQPSTITPNELPKETASTTPIVAPVVVPTPEIKKEEPKEEKKEQPKEEKKEQPKEEKKEETSKVEAPKTEEPKVAPPKVEEKSAKEIKEAKVDPEKEEENKKITEAISSLPLNVKPYFIALKYLSDENEDLHMKYEKEMDELDKKYEALKKPLYIQRQEFITGKREPTDADLKEKEKYNGTPKDQPKYGFKIEEFKDQKGIPEFWYKIFMNHPSIKDKIKPNDEPLLKHLIDISHEMLEDKDFKLKFVFSPNDYFENASIEMEFNISNEDEKKIICEPINWKAGKDLTKKTIKKKQKHKKTGAQRTITKSVDSDSFFTFFKTIESPDADEENDEIDAILDKLEDNADLGDILVNDIIDDALYFYFLIVGKEGEDDIEEVSEEDSEEEEKPKHKKSKDRKDSKADDKKDTKKAEAGKDCKQQ